MLVVHEADLLSTTKSFMHLRVKTERARNSNVAVNDALVLICKQNVTIVAVPIRINHALE